MIGLHALEICAINRLHFLVPVFGAGFSYHYTCGIKISGAKNVTENDVDDEFAVRPIAGGKLKLKGNKIHK